jgi:hypothetical protein
MIQLLPRLKTVFLLSHGLSNSYFHAY